MANLFVRLIRRKEEDKIQGRITVMENDRSGTLMWTEDSPMITLHQLRDYGLRKPARPGLSVLIPRRNVKVPHTKSKKLQHLQSKPRDPKASPWLLMVAPSSDIRYIANMKATPLKNSLNTLSDKRRTADLYAAQTRQLPAVSPKLSQRRQFQARHWMNQQRLLNGSQIPGPAYFQQLSTIAAMAWSDCSQATEKLRQIYEQTAFLSRGPFTATMSHQPALQYMTSTETHSNLQTKPQNYAQMTQSEMTGRCQSFVSRSEADEIWNVPSRSCGCPSCKLTKRTSAKQFFPPSDDHISYSREASRVNINRPSALCENQAYQSSAVTRQRGSLNKRTRPPDDGDVCPQPAKKLITQIQYSCNPEIVQNQSPGKNSVLYLKPHQAAVSENCTFPSNFYFPGNLQLPMTSSNSRDLVSTPSFDSQCFVNSQFVREQGFNGGMFNEFTNFLPPQILNALE